MSVANCPKCCVFLPFSSCHRLSLIFYSACRNTWISRCCITIHQSYFGPILLINLGYSGSKLLILKVCFCGIMGIAYCRGWANSPVIPLLCWLTCQVMSNTKMRLWNGKMILIVTMMTSIMNSALIIALKTHKIVQAY